MKKILTTCLLLSFLIPINAQQLRIVVTDIYPREGDDIKFNCELIESGLLTQFEEANSKTFPLSSCKAPDINIMTGTFELKKEYITSNNVKIGPLSYSYNGKTYYSDSLLLSIEPTLPNVTTGFWVNYKKFQGESYIIIEQRTNKSLSNNYLTRQKELQKIFVELNNEAFNPDDMIILGNNFLGGTNFTIGNKPKSERKYSYSKKIYKIWISDDYKNDFILTKEYFNNYSDSLNYKPITIKN